MSGSTPATRGRLHRHAFGRGAVALVSVALVGVVAVTTAWTSAHTDAAPTVVAGSLVKIDLESGKVVDVVPLGRDPAAIEIVGRYLFAASEDDGTLTRVDTRTGAVVTSAKYDATGDLAAEGAKREWVASIGRRQATAVDAAQPLLGPADPRSSPRVPLPRDTGGASLTIGGGALWIAAHTVGGEVVERWRLHPLGRQRTYRLGLYDYGNSVAFGYGAAWIALGAPADALLRVDLRTGRARRIPVGRFTDAVAAGFGSVWVAEKEDDTVRRIDPLTGRTRRVIAVGHLPAEVAVGQGSVWVASECAGTVSRIDPATDRVVRTIKLGHHPFNLAVGGGFGWVGVRKNVYFGTCS